MWDIFKIWIKMKMKAGPRKKRRFRAPVWPGDRGSNPNPPAPPQALAGCLALGKWFTASMKGSRVLNIGIRISSLMTCRGQVKCHRKWLLAHAWQRKKHSTFEETEFLPDPGPLSSPVRMWQGSPPPGPAFSPIKVVQCGQKRE